jgi:hypothetical protein
MNHDLLSRLKTRKFHVLVLSQGKCRKRARLRRDFSEALWAGSILTECPIIIMNDHSLQ